MAFDRRRNFCSELKKMSKILAFSDYSHPLICQAESVQNLARNRRRHGHDVTHFRQIVKAKIKTTIYRNETVY
jgi:hypothetical protein